MPGTDLPIEHLRKYRGSWPCPENFVEFWSHVAVIAKDFTYSTELLPVDLGNPEAEYFRVRVTAPDGGVLSAKYIRSRGKKNTPCVLQFHDYPAASRGWFHLTRYAAIGFSVLAPDCRGQGGESEFALSGRCTAPCGPLFAGLDSDATEDTYLYHLIADALLWANVCARLDGIDEHRIALYGEGQGGALALACAALYPQAERCAAHYPLFCDYRRVWDKDFDRGVYEGLRYYFRWHDPLHEKEKEIFDRLAYFDVVNFAPMIRCPTLISTGLLDMVSPPSAQFAVVNSLSAPCKHMVYPKHGHELNNFFENELLHFLISKQ